ncbi:MAG: hypothetical protein E6K54_01170 [Gammaproteobacteria bacterium]|nr:MAG: hypothetical protein E6K54_01170 [Gammaproteobacteria bacterium]
MSKPYLKIIESVNSFFQSVILSTIFVFKSNIYQIGPIFEKYLAPILFPLVIVPDAIASLFALYRFFGTKNKNLGKTFDLIYIPIKTTLVFTAVFAELSLIYIQGLFLIVVGSSVVYHLGLLIFHASHWFKSKKNSSARALHKNHILNNLIATIACGIVIAGIILTMIVAPSLAAPVLAIAGITTASLLMLATVYAMYRNFKNPSLSPTVNLPNEVRFEDSSSSTFSHSNEIQNQNLNYYHREFRSEKLTGKQVQDKRFLIDEIKNKIQSLEEQIVNSKNTVSEYFWPQERKRLAKMGDLEILNRALDSDNKALTMPLSKYASQSFFRDIGDCEDINLATKHYFQLYSSS